MQIELLVAALTVRDAMKQIRILLGADGFDFEVAGKLRDADHSAAAAVLARQQRSMLKTVSHVLLERTIEVFRRFSGGNPAIDARCILSVLRFSEDGAINSRYEAVADLQNEIAIQESLKLSQRRACAARFGMTICEETQTVTKLLPVIGDKTCYLQNPEHWDMFLLAVDNDGNPSKSQVHALQPNAESRNNCVSRLRSKLSEIQMTFKSARACYKIQGLYE